MSQINYLFWKSAQGINSDSCEPSKWDRVLKKKTKQGFKCEIEASTPELRAEQLRKIREQK